MLSQPPLWFIVIAFVLAIGPLVFIHEMGHYLVARWFGIGAETFSIGFGREIVGWTDKRGTRWKVGWLPLGGYVKFVGDMNAASQPGNDDGLDEAQRAQAFHLKPVWQRFLVVLAGPMANFLLAIAIFAAFFATFGMPRTPSIVNMVEPASAAAKAGLRPADEIVAINGQRTTSFEDLQRIVLIRPDERVRMDIVREGRPQSLDVTIGAREIADEFGQKFKVGVLGVGRQDRVLERLPLTEIIPMSVGYTYRLTRSMIDGLGQILVGTRSTKDLGGPLKMAQIAGQQATLGPFEFFQLLALFSINLGFINLLPVPMLDGGHLAFYTVEAVRRRPLSVKAQEWAFRGGLALLLALLMFTTVNDLASFGIADRLGRLIG
ncbi:RIP metalloprotease [Sphingomonas rhizophila]|uniref:RIP metalloprotease n=1 Tax=Sphingomonas rhizophila TaxID=2071607 RepID=A0A7G9SDI3_9SPHN|nr:M50 family metallopeptidase [Sphingomonas rhizophila]QNN65908.1 RIP metalloprotease [Sphingomonas rhizophila]